MKPQRIQLSRKKGFRLQVESAKLNGRLAVNVARPSGWGNPHRIGLCAVCGVEHTREEAIAEFKAECASPWNIALIKANLKDQNLACWCSITNKQGNYVQCHADILLAIANEMTLDEVRNENLKTHQRRQEQPD